ncbi:hypothetical protein A6U86_20510 [Rhizobium sp. AC27/96]|nr:hypothetical protein A6U86_20510 [Rhizobium sp. AC27/96]
MILVFLSRTATNPFSPLGRRCPIGRLRGARDKIPSALSASKRQSSAWQPPHPTLWATFSPLGRRGVQSARRLHTLSRIDLAMDML